MSAAVTECDVAVIGGGPAGLGLATRLKELGVRRVLVLERESAAGGIPRHCGHPPFGIREFHRILTGPQYAARLVSRARQAGVDIRQGTTVAALKTGPELRITNQDGIGTIRPRRVVLATGVRETPRSARLVSGTRPQGVITTGALQSMVYLQSRRPFLRPVIVGSELVAFSALLTCRHGGIRPVAMLEQRSRITAWRTAALLPRLQGIRLLTATELVRVEGTDRVARAVVRGPDGEEEPLDCDGVVFTGQFTSESTLARMGHLDMDPNTGGPVVDQFGRCSDTDYFATGNMLHPADNAGQCWREGQEIAYHVASSLSGKMADPDDSVPIRSTCPEIRYVAPQRYHANANAGDILTVTIRFQEYCRGHLLVKSESGLLMERRVTGLPEKRLDLTIAPSMLKSHLEYLEFQFRKQ